LAIGIQGSREEKQARQQRREANKAAEKRGKQGSRDERQARQQRREANKAAEKRQAGQRREANKARSSTEHPIFLCSMTGGPGR
jgi:hypothetical protein